MAENRHKSLGLTDENVLEMYRTMLLSRKIDERMWLLNRAGKIPFVISCQGQEATQIGAAYALNREEDYILPYYRDLGVVLAFGMTTRDLMLASFAKGEDPNSGGRQMPGHFGSKKHRIVTGSSPVTTQVPHAVGIALGAKMQGKNFVSFVTFGEGSSNQGDFHEGANFAGVHKLPVILMCENNKYAISVPTHKQLGCEKVSDRAAGYGMPGYTVDGTDVFDVYEATKRAADRARSGEGPTLIEAVSHRLTAHSSDDDDKSYRAKEELEAAKQDDPVVKFAAYLREEGLLTDEKEEELLKEIMDIINDATDYAEKAAYADGEHALKYVYGE
ncbi:thiamine pyrophosphate-dependent dehydrogenase E1 component subunit alpha [Priestia endophytica]|jgi:2-oxoisovalerate dehydrogenase E1 component alpha subunit|uniref:2-oxoisovalerate dehydrogenase subunit alpha n=1 Tax=Priestia endophytica TaxID=135735 RepID=A0AAX1QCP5_9BACI|nr:thiamine pyrophosphate-dependent dehydrogenase E1 component subunit alpha [Priestia endophytica]KAB2493666.1 thiamine pyrophosphate-dependent dehydrogenase E1 component subunit alpha [Priestia endophytica]MBG9814944.1 2-oxoisovalerate dehydrogenase [Priestia endophytica]MCM3539531.1 thiamine pyrophosphate-dependent dehydrogenase E1 component subunit alpha [Priestia endophytica]RAS79266.1 2-oxoisovalerate dehydrogenase [Priestia endophytica]RAS81855.1 2-oxoisovalerate dehydrogenase [Priestia